MMLKFIHFVWLKLLLVIVFTTLHQVNGTWNYIMFTQQWPPTVCEEWKQRNSSHECIEWQGQETWAVHGLWPSATTGEDPEFCNKSSSFNISLIQDLVSALQIYWPNMYKGTADDSFWGHEWNKHGTCAVTDTLLDDEHAYFHSGINLALKFNFYSYLHKHNIVPHHQEGFYVADFEAAIKSELGVTPQLRCYKHKNEAVMIQEMRICLDKALHVMECPKEAKFEAEATQSCPSDLKVLYPPLSASSSSKAYGSTRSDL